MDPSMAGMRLEVGGARTEEPSGPFIFTQVRTQVGLGPHSPASVELPQGRRPAYSIAVSFQRHTLT